MDIPPTYQEATSSSRKKGNWLKRFIGRLLKRSPPQPGLLVERKLIAPFDYTTTPFTISSKPTKSSRGSKGFNPPIISPRFRDSLHQSTTHSPPTNYVRIKRATAPILGVWKIDTSLVVPEELLVPLKDKSEKRHHLHLWSEGERIDADVHIVENEKEEEAECAEKVLLTVSSEGRVSLRVTKPTHRLLSVFCRGSIISVRIPRSYRGALKAHSQSGSVHFSDEVSKVVRSIYEKGKESRWFIGQMDSSLSASSTLNENGEEGNYDVMKLKARSRAGEKYGEIFVAYEDEDELANF